MAKQHMIIMAGLPASGKSRVARVWSACDQTSRVRINYDELRLEMFGPDFKWNRTDELKMEQEAWRRAADAIGAGKSLCIDNTNLKPDQLANWTSLAKLSGLPYEISYMETPIEECIERDRKRSGKARVGRAVIERMALFNGLIRWDDARTYPKDFIIVDMDGTLTDQTHRHHFIDKKNYGSSNWNAYYDGVGDDAVMQPIKNLVTILGGTYDILIVTGRPIDKAGIATEDWLRTHCPDLPIRHLFMRPSGDNRPDFEMKAEILDRLPVSRIAYVIEDRNQVVRMWRDRGLTTLQVADGDF